VEDPRVDLEPLHGARVAATKRLDESAPAVRVAPTATAARVLLDAVVGGRSVAHHAAERAPLEELLQVRGVCARRVEKARVAVVPLDEPERAAPNAERVERIEHRHARGVERGEARRQARLADVAHDRVGQIDYATKGKR
jgi:hypothetical protein